MTRRVLVIVAAGAVVVAVLVWVLLTRGPRLVPAEPPTVAAPVPTPTPAPEQRVVLLFVGSDGLLHPELRSVPLPAEVDERVRVVLGELLAGPTGRLASPFPYPAAVHSVFVNPDGLAFVDLSAPPEPLEGSHVELMLVYAVVDTVLLNCPELDAVQLLFAGQEVPTLTGHLDLSRPLALNKRFIASS